ncbi:MAG: hypothetical protein V8K32_10100 [Candidatus Electrothrix gigas]
MKGWRLRLFSFLSNLLRCFKPEPFDYTKWREEMDEEGSIEEISKKAMALRKK